MYRYDEFDKAFVSARVAEFSDQVKRRISGEMTEEEFMPLRLRNGVYLQLHAYMLRVAIPYGTLSSDQMRKLSDIAISYDRGYAHFTTRQNIQFNWLGLNDIPKILSELAEVEMHAIQTSGNCIRNITSDPFAGVAADESVDPRPYAEILRQWSLLHPEFSYLPRKFKFSITASKSDRAAIQVHDIGIQIKRDLSGELGFSFYIGGGQGRTPMVAKLLCDFVPIEDLLRYVTAVMRIYNLYGRRDNKYKARIKILVHETGIKELREGIERELSSLRKEDLVLSREDIDAIFRYFRYPILDSRSSQNSNFRSLRLSNESFNRWVHQNVIPHKHIDYGIVTISLKPIGGIPGDATSKQMNIVADLAERYSCNELRVTYQQNLVLPYVALEDLYNVYNKLVDYGLATANINQISDIIACPGLDYCSLANARSIPIAQEVSKRFSTYERHMEIGDMRLNISGCINACGHHHVGHIGILGVEKKGHEYYQLTLGGDAGNSCAIGEITGPGFPADEIVNAVERVINTYVLLRKTNERFIDTYRRVGMIPFRHALYGKSGKA
ncbi:MAG: sulfite reductase (NADPH) hemoprotein beta-component [Candidatus Tokpelaia sp. JSC161]|jgi:sulfite reductase (NADPH) hemoprotein beta-component|nr:MAG: sulfite reductase (NADPH) hemoprotein beta-component [Candidatus Tokpelaia sp. JSC161]